VGIVGFDSATKEGSMKKLTLGAIAAAALLAGGCGGSSGGSNSTSAATGASSTSRSASPAGGSSGSPGSASKLAPVSGTYSTSIHPADFVARVDNPYLPFKPGTALHYRGVAENGTTPQRDDEVVTHQTKTILGVKCTVVRDSVFERGAPVERTFDWYAQDRAGNVWYFGEDARDYKGGRFVKAPDSWQSGVNGAQPGIIMPGAPRAGESYRQEYYPGHAMDQARVVGVVGTAQVPAGTYTKPLVTAETSALEPGVVEQKTNARGIGVVEERVVKGDHERFELVSVTH
jgi:hypothetical protein